MPDVLTEPQRHWIDATLDLVEIEKRDGNGHMSSHWLFCRKVLGEKWDAIPISARFQDVALTREACELLAGQWWSCDCCAALVEGGTPLCPTCVMYGEGYEEGDS